MIESFKCKETMRIFEGKFSSKFPDDIQYRALVKLRLLDAARSLDDLRKAPGNRLEALKGQKKHLMSIRIKDQWRICFGWELDEVNDVEICDYH